MSIIVRETSEAHQPQAYEGEHNLPPFTKEEIETGSEESNQQAKKTAGDRNAAVGTFDVHHGEASLLIGMTYYSIFFSIRQALLKKIFYLFY
jgi:hypothetical protein